MSTGGSKQLSSDDCEKLLSKTGNKLKNYKGDKAHAKTRVKKAPGALL
jgi:hypothetical protein